MNDPFGLQASGLPPELLAKFQGLTQQQAVAQALFQQSQQGLKPPEVKGRFQGAISPLEGIAKVMQAYMGQSGMNDVTKGMGDIAAQRQQVLSDTAAKYEQQRSGTPEVPYTDTLGSEAPQAPITAGVKADPRAAITTALMSGLPEMKSLMESDRRFDESAKAREDTQAARVEDRKLQLQARMDELKMRLEDKQLAEGNRAALMLELQKMKGEMGQLARSPFFTPVSTTEGIYSFNNRAGTAVPLQVGGAAPHGVAPKTLLPGQPLPGQPPVAPARPLVKAADSPQTQGAIAYSREAAKGGGEADIKQHETVIAAADNVGRINDLITQLNSSDAITGMGAEVFKNIERAKTLVTGNEKAGKKVSDTEILDVMMGAEVFPMIQSLGVGARGMDTPAEREYMRKVLTGTIDMNKESLLRMAEIRKSIAERAMTKWNERVGRGELDSFFQATGRQKGPVGTPVKAAPATGGFPDAEKERRYQEWKASQK